MTTRLTTEQREEIRRDTRPVRLIAEELGRSKTTIQRWKHSEDVTDRSRKPKAPRSISLVEKMIFAELLRATRYGYLRLIDQLAPAWSKLPTEDRLDCRREGAYWLDYPTGKFVNKTCDPSTFYRQFKAYDDGQYLRCFDKRETELGAVAVHRVKVKWFDLEQKTIKGEILLLIERQTGLVYAKAFVGRIASESFGRALIRFQRMLPFDIKSLYFVSEQDKTTRTPSITSTLFNLRQVQRGDGAIPLSENSKDFVTDAYKVPVDAFLDPATPAQKDRILLPALFADRKMLDRQLATYCNLINLPQPKPGSFSDRPFKRIQQLEQVKTGRKKKDHQLEKMIRMKDNLPAKTAEPGQ